MGTKVNQCFLMYDKQSLFSSKIMTTNTSLGTPKNHSQVGGKVKIFTASGRSFNYKIYYCRN